MSNENDCLFCRMSNDTFPVDMIHEDGLAFAIRDINPRAPVHFMVIPRQHLAGVRDLTIEHAALLSHMYFVANKLADDLAIGETGYRLAFNVGPDSGQTVHHLHLHVLGGHVLGPEG